VAELDGLDAGAQHLSVAFDELVDLGGALARVLGLRAAVALFDDMDGAHPALGQAVGEEAAGLDQARADEDLVAGAHPLEADLKRLERLGRPVGGRDAGPVEVGIGAGPAAKISTTPARTSGDSGWRSQNKRSKSFGHFSCSWRWRWPKGTRTGW
jgi:hypothetical protein